MKKSFKQYSFLMLLFLTTLAQAQITKAEIRATGLTCSMCSNAINKQLKALPEVIAVETDLNTNTFIVTLKDTNQLTPKVFKEKVEKAGFFIGSLLLTATASTVDNAAYVKINQQPTNVTELTFQVLDKGYLTEKEFKKMAKTLKELPTYSLINEEDYHIKFLK